MASPNANPEQGQVIMNLFTNYLIRSLQSAFLLEYLFLNYWIQSSLGQKPPIHGVPWNCTYFPWV